MTCTSLGLCTAAPEMPQTGPAPTEAEVRSTTGRRANARARTATRAYERGGRGGWFWFWFWQAPGPWPHRLKACKAEGMGR